MDSILSKASKSHGMTLFLLPVLFVMPKMTCRMNILFSNVFTPKFIRLKYASLFSGPHLPLIYPSPQMAPYLPAIHHVQPFGIFSFMKQNNNKLKRKKERKKDCACPH
eukprot:1148177-Pelagomonas_calceolata.AAC.3